MANIIVGRNQTPGLNVVTRGPAPANEGKGPQILCPLQQPCGSAQEEKRGYNDRAVQSLVTEEHSKLQEWEWGSSKKQPFPHLPAREYEQDGGIVEHLQVGGPLLSVRVVW